MEIITGTRGSGKTTKAVQYCIENGYTLVVSHSDVRRLETLYPALKIISYADFIENRKSVSKVVIDGLDEESVAAITLNQNKEADMPEQPQTPGLCRLKYYAVLHEEYGWMLATYLKDDDGGAWYKDASAKIQGEIVKWVDLDFIARPTNSCFKELAEAIKRSTGLDSAVVELDAYKSQYLAQALTREGIQVRIKGHDNACGEQLLKNCRNCHYYVVNCCHRYPNKLHVEETNFCGEWKE